jgi:hypothetical protein
VYVAGRYSADNVLDVLQNIGKGEEMGAELFYMGFAPFVPWHDKDFVLRRPYNFFTVDQFYRYSLAWLEVSDVMVVLSGYEHSKGTLKEIKFAHERGIPVLYQEDPNFWNQLEEMR